MYQKMVFKDEDRAEMHRKIVSNKLRFGVCLFGETLKHVFRIMEYYGI